MMPNFARSKRWLLVLPLPLLSIGVLRAQTAPPKKMVPVAPPKTAPKAVPKAPPKTAPQAAPKTAPKPIAKPTPKPTPKATPIGKRSGEEVWRQACASCHGANGEGGKKYRSALTGDLSVNELMRYIHEYMPPEPAPRLPAAEAQRVAEYIHGAFYSPIAQERNRPPRVELSRLTVNQYRNAVTDLIASFRKADPTETKRGLSAKYFKRRQGNELALERIDPEIKFDFGDKGAIPEQDDPYQFVMHWQGSVIAPDTGEYEFIVRTEQAFKFWVNDPQTPLINAEIKSGNDTEYKASLFLLGGRAYPIRLEFFKGVTGVNNLEKLKKKPPQTATLALEWKMPKRPAEPIAQRYLLPVSTAPKFVVASPFPPDDRSIGYERGNSVSKEWNDATTEAAFETAAFVNDRIRELAGVAPDAPDRDAKLRAFCRKFVERAFRRPLTDEQVKFFIERQFENAPNPEIALKRVVLLALKSPRFLYRELAVGDNNPADAYDVASRLSFALWDSLPDDELLKAAAKNELSTREQVQKQAERLISDRRAWTKMRGFLLQWLKIEHYPDLSKDQKRFPEFTEAVASDLRTSLEMSLEEIVWGEKSDLRALLLTDRFYVNGRLAKVYGEALPENAPFQLMAMDEGRRSGILTHPYLLASFAYVDTSSPIHRGVLIARNLLGRALQPPPEAFAPLAAELHPKLTTRQRVALQTKPSACASCHNMINPLGFSLEHYDATGNLRTEDMGQPVDASGIYRSRDGEEAKFTNARDLAVFLTTSKETQSAFVEKLFQNIVKQPIRAYGPEALPGLKQAFLDHEFNMRRQMIESAVFAALNNHQTAPKTDTQTEVQKVAALVMTRLGGI